jgi:hypothetical protein
MVNGPMAEAQKGYGVLEDVDKGTFERFMEWGYKGYYKAAGFEIKTVSHPSPPIPTNEEGPKPTSWTEDDLFFERPAPELHDDMEISAPEGCLVFGDVESACRNSKKDKKGKGSKTTRETIWETIQKPTQELKESFLHRKYTVRRDVISIPPTRANRGEHEDYTEVFLSHARLYVFAEEYDIGALKTLALEELHSTLAIYTLYRCRTGDIIALLRYVYANTRMPDEGGEELRTLVRDYMGYEMSVLMQDEEFKDLMIEDGGAMLADFMEMVAKRIK